MSSAVSTAAPTGAQAPPPYRDRQVVLYAAAVVSGAVLMVLAALNQPFNQNEIKQMSTYGASDFDTITGATRQPPLDPLLGALVQHLLGEGQLRQRLVPLLAGIGTLIVMALLLRRLQIGAAGVLAIWLMATAPILIRYTAYSRPYSLPLFLMMLFALAGQQWLDGRRWPWLVVGGLAAAALPLTRVPEPTVFLLTTAAVLVYLGARGRYTWSQAGPVAGVAFGTLAFIGYPMYRILASKSENLWDPSPSGVADRFGSGVREIWHGLLPLLADFFPWWPLTILVIVSAVAIPGSRRRLSQWWFVWPLIAGPVIFVLAYHFLNPFPFNVRPYRARMAIFFIPGFTFLVAALAAWVVEVRIWESRLRVAAGALLLAALVSQLPRTVEVLVDNEAADFGAAADTITADLPPDAIVLYDTASPLGRWHQPFTGQRYMGSDPYVGQASNIPRAAKNVPREGPVYFLILDSECAFSVECNEPLAGWDGRVDGWTVLEKFDKFTLYEPTDPLEGRDGVVTALKDFGTSMGVRYGTHALYSAAAVLKVQGKPEKGRALIRRLLASVPPETAEIIQGNAAHRKLDPFD